MVVQNLSTEPSTVGEWIVLLDGLSANVEESANEVNEFAARVKSHPLAVTPGSKRVRYSAINVDTPNAWENFVDLDTMQIAAGSMSSMASTI
jgi:hypothetical protein